MAFNREAAKKAGYTDEEIEAYLSSKGTSGTKRAKTTSGSTEPQWGDLVGNIPQSAARTGQALLQPFLNPMDTIAGIGGLAGGAVQKFTPGVQEEEQLVDQLLGFYKDRYGGASNIKNTLIEDPVGALMDASMLVSGGGTALKGAGALSKSSKLAKAGNIATKVGEFTDPISLAGKAMSPIGRSMDNLPANITSRYINPDVKKARELEVEKSILKNEPRLGEELASKGKIPITPKRIIEVSHKNIEELGPKIEEIIEANKNKRLPMEKVIEPLDSIRSKLMDSLEGKNNPLIKKLDDIENEFLNKVDENFTLSIEDIYKPKKNTDEILGKFYDSGNPTKEVNPQTRLKAEVNNVLRDIINKNIDELMPINKEYNFWNKIKKATVPLAEKGFNLKPTSADLFFGSAGLAAGTAFGGPFAGILTGLTGLAGRKILGSPTTGLLTARLVQELLSGTKATSRVTGPTSRTSYMLERPLNESEPSAQLAN